MKKKGQQGVIVERGTGDGMYISLPEAPFAAGDTVVFAVRADDESERLFVVYVTEFDENGRAFIGLTAADTLSLPADSYVYGVNLIRSGAEPVSIIRSAPFIVQEAVARDE